MAIDTRPFGRTPEGAQVCAHTISHPCGASVTLLDWGVTIQALRIPAPRGETVDVVLGYDTLEEYLAGTCYLGAVIGRVCGRIGGGVVTLGGQTCRLAQNDGENHLHGGVQGFDRRLWHCAAQDEQTLLFSRLSPHGEEGYPGNLEVQAAVSLTDGPTLRLDFTGHCDRETVVSLTSHSYFNLAGRGSVADHLLELSADSITEIDAQGISTGRLLPVAGTPFDFRAPKPLGQDWDSPHPLLRQTGGYDHNYVLSGRSAAVLSCRESGLAMALSASLPGLQLYTANFLTPCPGKGGRPMGPRAGVCLEPQLFPDAMHHYGFPSPILRPRETLRAWISYAFSPLE